MKQEQAEDIECLSDQPQVVKGKNMHWNDEMDSVLDDVLRDACNMGHKRDGGWKPAAYNNAAAKLSSTFKIKVRAPHVRNRVKHWKSVYAVIRGILGESGLSWNSNKHMIEIEDDNEWNTYCLVHDNASKYQYRVIPNWNDIVDLCRKDRATGEGDETALEANDVMSTEARSTQDMEDVIVVDNYRGSDKTHPKGKRGMLSSSSVDPPRNKRVGDDLSSVVSRMATSLQAYMQSNKLDVNEVCEEVKAIPDLDHVDRLRALNWLVDNDNKFRMLQKLPIEEKNDFLLMCLP